MPDDDLPDVRTPVADEGHEALRQHLEQAIDELAQTVADLSDSFLLNDVLFGLLDAALAALAAATAEREELRALAEAHRIRIDAVNISADTALADCDALQVAVAALTDRVTALEAPTPPAAPEETP